MIGAKDVAFPKLNLLCLGIFMFWEPSLVIASVLFGNGIPDTGWTFYAPYSFKTGTNLLPGHIRGVCAWIFFDFNRTKFHRNHSSDACPGHDLV